MDVNGKFGLGHLKKDDLGIERDVDEDGEE